MTLAYYKLLGKINLEDRININNIFSNLQSCWKGNIMNTVRKLLQIKGDKVFSIHKDATVFEALEVMGEKGVGSVVVMDGDKMVGIFTERDHARRVGLLNREPGLVRMNEVMSSDIITVNPSQTVRECMQIMTESRVRHLPVYEEGKLVGLVSIGDVVRDLIEELEFFVNQLENYISGLR